jgi:hypothetical protein
MSGQGRDLDHHKSGDSYALGQTSLVPPELTDNSKFVAKWKRTI